jgi:hypothetical protein
MRLDRYLILHGQGHAIVWSSQSVMLSLYVSIMRLTVMGRKEMADEMVSVSDPLFPPAYPNLATLDLSHRFIATVKQPPNEPPQTFSNAIAAIGHSAHSLRTRFAECLKHLLTRRGSETTRFEPPNSLAAAKKECAR